MRLIKGVAPAPPRVGFAELSGPALGTPPRAAFDPPPRPAAGAQPRPAQDPPLRLTMRGRVVLAGVVALAVAVLSLLAASAARAVNHSLPPRQHLVQVRVPAGQSLWAVAESADPGQDTRLVVGEIIELNSLASDTVFAGQQLWVPRG